ncbi:MAG TPA: hypothetical protein VF375_05935 [Candidatus Limnocylindrales bacterium]
MTSKPRAFFALDFGSASTSAAVLGYVGGRWRLISHATTPSHVDVDVTLAGLLKQIEATDPEMLREMGAGETIDIPALITGWARLEAKTTPQRHLVVLGGSRRQRKRLETTALRAGWMVAGGSADEDDPVGLSRLLMSTDVSAVLLGADHSPAGDEKRHLPGLAALLAAATRSRPELMVVLAGGAAAYESLFSEVFDGRTGRDVAMEQGVVGMDGVFGDGPDDAIGDKAAHQTKKVTKRKANEVAELTDAAEGRAAEAMIDEGGPEPYIASNIPAPVSVAELPPTVVAPPSPRKPAAPVPFRAAEAAPIEIHVLLAPDTEAGYPAGSSLQQVLEGLRALPNDSRLGVERSIASLAYVLDRSIEVVEVGLQGGLSARSQPFGQGHAAVVSSHACVADASFAPTSPSEEVIDGLLAWSTASLDRHKAMDRLNDLRLAPWGEADGDGAVFRLAAAKGAFGRLMEAMPELAGEAMPELLVAAGGIFASLPPSVVALAMADLVRRAGVSQLAVDEARLLGPLGVIEDEGERRRLLANLANDILLPLGSLVMPAGIKAGRSAGTLRMKGAASISEIELHPGAVQVVDLPPGRAARADLDFRDAVRLGKRGHHFSVDVGGGMCGLLVDLRDIPMRISDRPDSRRAALEAWQRGMWPEVDE